MAQLRLYTHVGTTNTLSLPYISHNLQTNSTNMKFTYDKEANAAYIYFRKSQKVRKTKAITNDVVIDFGARGELLGIEILNASSHVARKDLQQGVNFTLLPA